MSDPQASLLTSLMSPSPLKMTEVETDLMSKCLEFKALVDQGKVFTLNMTCGNFSFSLDSRGDTSREVRVKRKLSPSQQRRNLKRKETSWKMKTEPSEENFTNVRENCETIDEKETEEELRTPKLFKCNLCEKSFKTERGVKTHNRKSHEVEQLRDLSSAVSSLKGSPVKDPPQECEFRSDIMSPQDQCETPPEQEPNNCHCCGEVMSPTKCHGCGNEFNCETQLQEHISDNHPSMCHICNESFNERYKVSKHWKEHHRPA